MRSGFWDFHRSERNLQVEEIMMRTNSKRANGRRAVLSLASLIALHGFSLAFGQETESKTPAKNPTGVSLGEAKLAGDGFKFTEGPTVDPEGNVYFTDQPNDRIVLWTVEGKLSEFLKPAGRSNGMYFAPDGKLLACADEANELWELDLSGKHGVLLKEFEGTKLNGPNDVWVDQGGTIYFTDPYYQRPWWDHKKQPQRKQSVYKSDRNGSNLVCVDDALVQPNGIIGDSARRLLYVADIGDR